MWVRAIVAFGIPSWRARHGSLVAVRGDRHRPEAYATWLCDRIVYQVNHRCLAPLPGWVLFEVFPGAALVEPRSAPGCLRAAPRAEGGRSALDSVKLRFRSTSRRSGTFGG